MLPVGEDATEAFYRIIDAAYERRSIAVTSNIHPSGFDTIMPKTLAGRRKWSPEVTPTSRNTAGHTHRFPMAISLRRAHMP
ncbi:hypothetical protein [Streptomyces sp. NPDC048419]|uniref:hypothetical protein n=1 Tax=Streptomyces sp. NPDC048419 TaxID=3365547 RepID=UPI00372211D5